MVGGDGKVEADRLLRLKLLLLGLARLVRLELGRICLLTGRHLRARWRNGGGGSRESVRREGEELRLLAGH